MKITIITATFNSATHIKEVSESIEKQTYTNLEWIVIDGSSTDGTIDLLKNNKTISALVSEPDKGIYDALNKGIDLATGDVIGFLHSDDLFNSPETLKYISEAFGSEGVSIVYGDLIFVDQHNTNEAHRYWKSEPFYPSLLKRGWMPPHPTVFMRKEVYEKHGLFNINLKCSADYDHLLRVFSDPSLKTVYIPVTITKMRIGGRSTKGLWNLITKKREDYLVLRHNCIPRPFITLLMKNLLKIPQLLNKQD